MKYVQVERSESPWGGYSLDADPYLNALPVIQDKLPHGARTFAIDDDHYNFFGPRCIKDLRLGRVEMGDQDVGPELVLAFAPNRFKHDQGLTIRYSEVSEFIVTVGTERITNSAQLDVERLGDVQLDEILPHARGCSHEIQTVGGCLWIVAADLLAHWQAVPDHDTGPL